MSSRCQTWYNSLQADGPWSGLADVGVKVSRFSLHTGCAQTTQ